MLHRFPAHSVARPLCGFFGCGLWSPSESLRAFLCGDGVSLLDGLVFFFCFCLRSRRSFSCSWRRAIFWRKASVSFLFRRTLRAQGLASALDGEGDDGERCRRRVLGFVGDGDGEPEEAAR